MDPRAAIIEQKDHRPSAIRYVKIISGAKVPVVFVMPPNKLMNRYKTRVERRMPDGSVLLEPMVGETEYETECLMTCLFRAVLDKDRQPVIGEDGLPLLGKPLFEKADAELLNNDSHMVGGWRQRLVSEFGDFCKEAGAEIVRDLTNFINDEDKDGAEGNGEPESSSPDV